MKTVRNITIRDKTMASKIMKIKTLWSGTLEHYYKLELTDFRKFIENPKKKTRQMKLSTVETLNIRTLDSFNIATIFLKNGNVLISFVNDICVPEPRKKRK